RLAWLTGFGGSAGTAAVLKDKAAIFVDGRYTLQVRAQADGRIWEYKSVPEDSIGEWLAANAGEGAKMVYDPWLHARGWGRIASKALEKVCASLVAVDTNPVDAVWEDQPETSAAKALPYDEALAGRASADKRGEVAAWLEKEGFDAAVISAL